MTKEEERTLVGCRVLEENNNYRIYELLKRLRKKKHIITKNVEEKIEEKVEEDNTNSEDNIEPKVA